MSCRIYRERLVLRAEHGRTRCDCQAAKRYLPVGLDQQRTRSPTPFAASASTIGRGAQ